MTVTTANIIDELADMFSSKSVGQQADVLKRVTDLFLSGADGYDSEQLEAFDSVLTRLSRQIETIARVTMAERLSIHPRAPAALMEQLAADPEIDVARPVLVHCTNLSETALIETAKSRGQSHLLAISGRDNISENVTDVLVERGNTAVALSVVRNRGARFSDAGYSRLSTRSETEDVLAFGLFQRTDVPRQHLVKLFANASATVRQKLESIDRRRADDIRKIVNEVVTTLQRHSRAGSREYREALALVHTLRSNGQLDEPKLREFAEARKFDETAITLSLLCDLPIDIIERGMATDQLEMLLIFAKALDLEWATTRAILRLKSQSGEISAARLEQSLSSYTRLKQQTARKAIEFYRLREKAGANKAVRPN